MTSNPYREKVLPLFLFGKVEDGVLHCYTHHKAEKGDLDAGFGLGLTEGVGLGKLLGTASPEVDAAVRGARFYADREAGIGEIDGIPVDFNEHRFLYGYFHGLELSTSIAIGRDTFSDVGRAFKTVLESDRFKDSFK